MDKKEQKIVGQLKPHRGHTVYEYNKSTSKLTLAVFEKTEPHENKAIKINEDCVYVSALNIKNAIKKLCKYYRVINKINLD